MYGEDVDYSYRLQREGYNNYYFPEIKIIHYKGESTKNENLNVLVNFYKAMIIFVRKHFANGSLKTFTLLIHIAIFFRAGLSVLKQFMKRIFFPLTDGILVYFIFRLATSVWGVYKYGIGYKYPETFTENIIPAYTLIIILSILSLSGYKIPVKPFSAIKGVLTGTILILIVYALLPLDLRFSRAIIITGGLMSLLAVPLWRLFISVIGFEIAENPFSKNRKTVIVSDSEGYSRVKDLMLSSGITNRIAGRVSIRQDDMKEEVLGSIEQIREVIRINKIKEIIFTTRNLSASQVIDSMHAISDFNIKIRIASADESYIIGSRYVNPKEDIIILSRTSFSARIIDRIKNLFG
jgi:FlaA1/EpsC-like NDP-sugar epimerase